MADTNQIVEQLSALTVLEIALFAAWLFLLFYVFALPVAHSKK